MPRPLRSWTTVPIAVGLLMAVEPSYADPVRVAAIRADRPVVVVAADRRVRVWRIFYLANDGRLRRAYVTLPRWYGPEDDPPLPLVISQARRDRPRPA
jgi:hypothetical protein